jgi:serine/threonine protein kinase/Tol biopolymer transport system component
MDARTWASAKDILAAAAALPAAEQRAYVERHCTDPALKSELLALLESPAPLSDVIGGAMMLTPGSKLGPYEIVELLGAGGMGEVYKARDPRLGRHVAIKVLPARSSADPQAGARFTHEARAIAAFNHPHICAIYDVGEEGGRPYFVMELLDGETLHQRLKRIRLKPQELLEHGIALADALSAAHGRGVIHRDLKPSNIVITKSGELKVLDFGLAKHLPALTITQTVGAPLTAAGGGVGTLAYMSPEQMRGEDVDARTDLFSLGAVLYEMATGRPAFEGATSGVVIDAILNEQPPMVGEIRADLPATLGFIVDKALEKDRALRYQDALGLRADLVRVRHDVSRESPEAKRRRVPLSAHVRRARKYKVLAALAPAGLILGVFAGWLRFSTRVAVAPLVQFEVLKQSDTALGSFALSPDGRYLAYVDAVGEGAPQIYVRPLGSAASRPLAGTEGAHYPFWSPDSREIGFFTDDTLRRVSVSGSSSQRICPVNTPLGGAWSGNGVIVFGDTGGLWQVPDTAGKAKLIVADSSNRVRWPQFLPDGRRFLYFDLGINRRTFRGVRVGSLDDTETPEVLETPFMGRYALPGYLFYLDDQGNLVARRFDATTLELSGGAQVVAQRVGVNRNTNFRNASFSVSDNESVVVGADMDVVRLQWIDRSGTRGAFVGNPDAYSSLELSPDGKRVALEVPEPSGQGDLWILDLVRGDRQAFTRSKDPFEYRPRWSPDGEWIAYSWTTKSFQGGIRRRRIDGVGGEEVVLEETPHRKFVSDWSRDGTILFRVDHATPDDSKPGPPVPGVVAATGTSPPPSLPLPPDQHMADARYSPNGKLIAYVSDETGTEELYLQRVGSGGLAKKASIAGGQFPVWREDGAELYYVAPAGTLFAVPVTGRAGAIATGTPVALFHLPFFQAAPKSVERGTPYTTRDGRRFLVRARLREGAYPLTWTMNWRAAASQK